MHTATATPQIINNIPREDRVHNGSLPAIPLIQRLCDLLSSEEISYCHWKSNDVLERSASGENDLDLLVSRVDVPRFTEILYRLGFKRAFAPADKQMPGVLDYFGYDEETDKLIHVHAHYQLIIGHDMTKNYRLPIEKQYLESAVQGDLFKVPAIEFEFIVFIIRMILKHSTWDVIVGRQGQLKTTERRELDYLHARINQDLVYDILNRFLPCIDIELFGDCIQALQPHCSIWFRIKTGHQLQVRLQAYARRSSALDIFLKLWRRAVLAICRRVFKSSNKYRLENGGFMIAVVGGDGAGKSTAVAGLYTWFSNYFETTQVHMGKPDWSLITVVVRGILRIGKLFGLYPWEPYTKTDKQKSIIPPRYPWLLREICRARDRYRTFRCAYGFAVNGNVVILDRYPLPQIQIMDGPQAERYLDPNQANRFTRGLVKLENRYYDQVVLPDTIIVLRVNPEIAVQRKTDEDANSVRERSREIWETDWDQTGYHIIEAGKSEAEVLAEIKVLVWSNL